MKKEHKHYKISETLLKIGSISEDSVAVFSSRTRDNQNLKVYKDINTDVIFIDDYYIGDEEYINGTYRASQRINDGMISYEELSDTNRRIKSLKPLLYGKKICDFSCGACALLKSVRPFVSSFQGVEIQSNLRESLNSEGIPCYKSINEINEPIDVVTLFHCLEHLPDPLEKLITIREKLITVDGNLLIIEVPHARDFLLKDLACAKFIEHTLWSQHLVLHTRESLQLLLSYAGFKNILISGVQRYNLANHLHWLNNGKPGGHISPINRIESGELREAYSNALSNIDANDTLVAIATVEG